MKGSGTRRQTFAGLIKQRQADLHITAKTAMQMMGMPPTTYRRKVLNPETITVLELAAFRMWQAVRVRSRNFLVAKLSIRVSAIASGVDVSADLISL